MSAQKYTKCSLSNVSRFDNRHFQRRFYPDDAHNKNPPAQPGVFHMRAKPYDTGNA